MNWEMRVDNGGGREHTIPVDYPSNSMRSRKQQEPPPEKRVEPVVTGEVIQRKKSWRHRFKEDFLPEDGVEGIINIIITDILFAKFKEIISGSVESITGGINDGFNRVLFGDNRRPGAPGQRTPYYSYSGTRNRPSAYQYATISPRARARHDFHEVILQTRGEAEEVLDNLRELIDVYGSADVADFYSLLGTITPEYTDKNYGWYNLQSALVRHVRGGYLIDLPQPQLLE